MLDDSHAVDKLKCDIILQPMDDPNGAVKIGYIKFYYCNLTLALNNGLSSFWAVDNFSALASWFIDKETDDLREEIKNQVGEAFFDNILLGEEFVIYPEFRGKGFGEETLRGLVKHFEGRCGYFAFKSFPLQCEPLKSTYRPFWFRKRLRLDDLVQDRKVAQKSMNAFYKRCGFTALKKEPDYFIRNMWPV